MNVMPIRKEHMMTEDKIVHKHAPSAENKPFSVVERRYSPDNAATILAHSDAFLAQREAMDGAWLMELRKNSLAHLRERGLLTPRLERWKYTRALGFDNNDLTLQVCEDNSIKGSDLPESLSPLRLIFVNGFYSAALSKLPDGVAICGDAAAFQSEDFVRTLWNNAPVDGFNDQMQWALNSLYSRGGAVICIPKNMIMEQTIDVVYITTQPHYFMPRTLLALGDNAKAVVTERFIDMSPDADKKPQTINAVCRVAVGQNAHLTHHKFNQFSTDDMVLSTVHITQARDSHYIAYNMGASAAKMRREQIWAQLQGENAECLLNGVQLAKAAQEQETVITMTHEAPHCHSNQNYRHIAADMSSCHFQGKVHVHQIAQKTDAYQMSRGVVLSDHAQVNTKLELEIYADDVSCSHGATTGQIDEDALFYMRSRGLSKSDAYRMLLTSFAADVFEGVEENDIFAEEHIAIITKWLKEVA